MCDVIVGNDVDFGFMAGDYDRGLDKARSFVAEGAKLAVYKMGEQGAITITPEGEVPDRHLPDGGAETHGRGRQFHGRFSSAASADGLSVRDAVLQGSAAAAMVVAARGLRPGNARPRRARRIHQVAQGAEARPERTSAMHIPPHDNRKQGPSSMWTTPMFR